MEGQKGEDSFNDSAVEVDDRDAIVTMVDVLEQENAQEEDANAILGGVDDKSCTYSEGYLGRQPLYACNTCCKDEPAGVCLACSYRCHEGHDLVELYTKRNFRCDCGTAAFGENKCFLDPVKDEENTENSYNQNFKGVYCTCARPYPDPDDDVDDVMLQCVICEDWFHGRHLESKDPAPQNYEEITCHLCMEKMTFLRNYALVGSDKDTSIVTSPEENIEPVLDVVSLDKEKANGSVDAEASSDVCKLTLKEFGTGAAYFPNGWREKLCRCSPCLELYEKLKVTFLLDEKDTIKYYEEMNKERKKESQYEQGMKALSSLDRVKQIEAIQSYNEMKTALMEHLVKFKETKRVVSEEDIRDFFSQMKAKRPRLDIQNSCR